MANAPVDPNAPDLLAPKAAELIAWLEQQITWHEENEEFGLHIAADRSVRAAHALANEHHAHATKLREVITLLRERDIMAAVLVREENDCRSSRNGACAPHARHAIAKLHATHG